MSCPWANSLKGPLHAGADRVAGRPLRGLLLGAYAYLQVAQLSRREAHFAGVFLGGGALGADRARPALAISDLRRMPELLASVIIPDTTALSAYGQPTDQRAGMLVETRLGAARLIASQAAPALRPDDPQPFKITAPPDPTTLRDSVTGDFNALFLLLAGITLVIGAMGIANTTLVAVLERTGEIGPRRALGARPRHIAAQFLSESAALGTLGGLVGTSLGTAVVAGTALARQWTAVLAPWAVLPAPLIGTLVGLLAGLYPAQRAAAADAACSYPRP